VSKPPYLTALALWPKGDCWHGGGLFKSNRLLWLNHKPLVAIPHKDHVPVGLRVEANPDACGEDDPIYSMRLERDGWKKLQDWKYRYVGRGFKTDQPEIREKVSRQNFGIKLVMNRSISVFRYKEGFSVVGGGHDVEVRGAEWADWDHAGRLVFRSWWTFVRLRPRRVPRSSRDGVGGLESVKTRGYWTTGLG